ncbi:hypothetical protein [Nocardiopsis sp. HUAS JQ3]|uniref:hypothetical protein n=1 Tax=Nocardiopsis sp. HUAS JQ3 TaxID=3061629 RepID=UPI0023A9CFFF|nr:hypothetical protein [Nocardiopsis sp. HUAS JQ3]WDZ92859.1 hypothetical protein PV789_10150 [Nocardiopsis sp. HUAS JQ3]
MGHRKAWVLVLGVITLVLAGFWAAPRFFPDLGWGLNELNQIAGIASLPVGVASLLVGLWALRSSSTSQTSSAPSPGGVVNTITGNSSGTTVQAHTVHGGIGNTTHRTGDHVDFSGGTFYGPVTGRHEEHHSPDTTRNDEHP